MFQQLQDQKSCLSCGNATQTRGTSVRIGCLLLMAIRKIINSWQYGIFGKDDK